ncbi:hypothetical protein D9758_009713 [Tetrapyrgos nigripes]|uniref:C2H2-type domain-containing protein n=1 Tax=Tetrapyrgos nigripes TaxID=182062 RepID=A0A8H5FQP8_9AGAR|nr:hypothetical protein D9758_009713 [Tetrapyrgos nigripes]
MVRASSADESPGKKESTLSKKKAVEKKKTSVAGVWPCKMNGCNKQFAREADLKRHQRTTKVHSMPGFACPQCDATFTRTDALRRHQKSRHNGVIIEPMDQDKKESEEGQSSRSSSEAPSPSKKGKAPAKISALAQTVQGKPGASGPATGHTSYYRQHTANMSPYVPTRLTAAQWSNHQWPDGRPPPPMGSMAVFYIPPSAPTPHHPSDSASVASPPPASASSSHTQVSSHTTEDNAEPSGSVSNRSARASPTLASGPPTEDNGRKGTPVPAPPPEPPSLPEPPFHNRPKNESKKQSPPPEPPEQTASPDPSIAMFTKVLGMDIMRNGIQRVLETAKARDETAGSHSPVEEVKEMKKSPESLVEDRSRPPLQPSIPEHGYGSPMERPQPLEHMLTEDGEPMLNPGLAVSHSTFSIQI